MHVVFNKSNAFSKYKSIEDDDDVNLKERLNDLKLNDKSNEGDQIKSQLKEE